MRCRLLPFVLAALAIVSACASTDEPNLPVVDVYEISGPLDPRGLNYLTEAINRSQSSTAVILQLDSPAVLGGNLDSVLSLIGDPPVPVAVWVGPAPAVAYGGVLEILSAAEIKLAAPGARLGYPSPTIAGSPIEGPIEQPLLVKSPVPGLIDATPDAVKQAVLALDGRVVEAGGRTITLDTATSATDGDRLTVEVRFHKPDLLTRFLRLAVQPDTAFFFLVAGLTIAAFEFYAIGPGVGAAVALLSLLLGGYGVSVLPVRWWAVGLALVSVWLLTVSFQRGRVFALNLLGLAGLVVAGSFFTDAAPQIIPTWWGVLLTVAATAFFFVIALPAVGRSRFSTPSVGRQHLIGLTGVATIDHQPDGVVEVAGGRWPSTAHREAHIKAGDRIKVTEIDGRHLAVEPDRS